MLLNSLSFCLSIKLLISPSYLNEILSGYSNLDCRFCSHEIKRCLLLGRKVMTNLESILKRRDITLSTKVRLVKAMVYPVVMYGCESWIIKKAERRRTDAFEMWCLRRLLKSLGLQGDPTSPS